MLPLNVTTTTTVTSVASTTSFPSVDAPTTIAVIADILILILIGWEDFGKPRFFGQSPL